MIQIRYLIEDGIYWAVIIGIVAFVWAGFFKFIGVL